MTFAAFKNSLGAALPPAGLSPILQALWYDAKNNWEAAHNIAQSAEGTYDFDRIHAYLHRKEGDAFNASYWYKRVGMPKPSHSLEAEWAELVEHYLEN